MEAAPVPVGSPITAGALGVLASSGSIDLDNAANAVATFAAQTLAGGDIDFRNAGGLATGLSGLAIQRLTVTQEGAVAAQSARVAVAAPWLILLGVLALRAAVLFSVQ